MKRADSEADARASRDISIECMALLDRTVFHAKHSCSEEFFIAYRGSCADLMGEFGDVINRAAYDYPALRPSEEEWVKVASSRVLDADLPVSDRVGPGEIRSILGRVRKRSAEVQSLTPRMAGEPGVLNEALDKVDAVAADWRLA